MYRSRIPSVEYIAANTDAQALAHTDASIRLRVGDRIAQGMGVGGNPNLGRECFLDSREEIREVLRGADLVFVAAGMGGGTGTGGAPVVANIAKQELGCLTVGVVTKPFPFEGFMRDTQAQKGLERLEEEVDTLIVIPNERLLMVASPDTSMEVAFRMADEVLKQGIQSITELLLLPGEINLDFADLRTVMNDAGPAWMAIGKGNGIDRAEAAIQSAMTSPLLEVGIEGATGVMLNITGGPDLMMGEVRKISEAITSQVDSEAEIIFGTTQDLRMENELKIIIIATGFRESEGSDEGEVEDDPDDAATEEAPDVDEVEVPQFMRAD